MSSYCADVAHIGFLLDDEQDGKDTVHQYIVFKNGVVAIISGGAQGSALQCVPKSLQPYICARHPDSRLKFPENPVAGIWREKPLLQEQAIDPKYINLVYTGLDAKNLLRRRGQLLAGDWDEHVQPIVDTVAFRSQQASSLSGRDGAKSDSSCLEVGVSAIVAQDLKAPVSKREKPVTGVASLAIDRLGRYVVIDGISQVLFQRAARETPINAVIVARHPLWERFRKSIVKFAARHKGRIYQRILHPDLSDIPASHDEDRLPLIEAAFRGYDPAGKRLVDIGAHWGQMSAKMESLGFEVTAVEQNVSSVEFAKTLRDALGCKYKIWSGSVFEFPDIKAQNVILGLNIFHHFLKSKEMFESLKALLSRSQADIIVFAAHNFHRKGPDFKDAHVNFPPDDFAKFVSDHSGLGRFRLLGHTHDGRPMYKIFARE